MAVLEREAAPLPANQATPANWTAPTFVEPRLWTRDEYYKMAEAGILGPHERVELIEGRIVKKMAPIGPFHSAVTDPLGNILRQAFGSGYTVRTQNPIVLSNFNEPEPDIAVVVGGWQDYITHKPGPSDIRLIVEVSDSSLAEDRTDKLRIYASEGIAEYWILNLKDKQIEVYREPADSVYREINIHHEGASVEPLFAPGKTILVSQLLPRAVGY